jgi:hypothetical protein
MKPDPNNGPVNSPQIRLRSRRRRRATALVLIGSTALVLAGTFLVARQSGLHLDDVIASMGGSSPVAAGRSRSVEASVPTAPVVTVIRSKSVEPAPRLAPATERPTGTVVPRTMASSADFGDSAHGDGRSVPGMSLSFQPPGDSPRGASIAALPLQFTSTALTSPPAATTDAAASSAPDPGSVLQRDPAPEKLDPLVAETMARRAAAMIKMGDIAAARVLLERPARGGYAQAIFALAETYDPRVLTHWGVHRPKGDMAQARILYGEALRGGVTEARDRLGESDRSATKALVLGQP